MAGYPPGMTTSEEGLPLEERAAAYVAGLSPEGRKKAAAAAGCDPDDDGALQLAIVAAGRTAVAKAARFHDTSEEFGI